MAHEAPANTFSVGVASALRWLAGVLLLAAMALPFAGRSAEAAVIYCTRPGYPAGCVVATNPAPAARAVVYCTRPGYPVGCVAGAAPAARAAVYCTRPGYPAGCVPGPGAAGAPAARAAVYCTRPGYPAGCVASPAGVNANARAVARPGAGVNGGGAVNYPGLR